jgi:hypothetical protein
MLPERRKCERSLSRAPLTLRLGEEDTSAVTLDVSPHGARILTNLVLVPGQTIEITCYKAINRSMSCRVVWVSMDGSDRPVEVGLEFLD